jgi:hypothetical protein
VITPLASGTIDDAVPRVLEFLDADLANDKALVDTVIELCCQLTANSS